MVVITYLAAVRIFLSFCSFFWTLILLSGTGGSTRIGIRTSAIVGARVSLFLEAVDNIASAHTGL